MLLLAAAAALGACDWRAVLAATPHCCLRGLLAFAVVAIVIAAAVRSGCCL